MQRYSQYNPSSDDAGSFGIWFRWLLHDRGTTMTTVARFAGVSLATTSRWASDKSTPDVEACQAIAVALDVPVNLVLTRAGHGEIKDVDEQRLLAVIEQLEQDRARLNAELEHLQAQVERARAELSVLYQRRDRDERIRRIQTWSAAIAHVVFSRPATSWNVIHDRVQQKLLEAEDAGDLHWGRSPRE